jgi:hypothetical protein
MARCYSIRGTRYSPVTTGLIWEYCRRYHFSLSGNDIIMLTAERIHSMGGRAVKSVRYPLLSKPTPTPGVNRGTSNNATSFHDVQLSLDERTKSNSGVDAAEDVVPLSFTLLVRDEVVTLYNALETDVFAAIAQRMERQRKKKGVLRPLPENSVGRRRRGGVSE